MAESQSNSQQLAKTAANVGRAARIAKATAVGGLKGGAVEVAKQSAPFLAKLALGFLIVVVLVPIAVFTYMPNIFFGYKTSETIPVKEMTERALYLGNTYLTLEDFENTQMDAVVTGIISEYEEDGVEINRVVVNVEFDEDDLCWLIAINSVAHQQNLNEMTAADIYALAVSRIVATPSLGSFLTEGNTTETTLEITFEHLDPDTTMERLGFDEEAQTWAGALFEVLSESDALDTYAEEFGAYRPNYNGDDYKGRYERGSGSSDEIDISGFISPNTKNAHDLAAFAIQAWENGWGYVWGTYGNVLTPALLEYKVNQYPDGVGKYEDFIESHWLNHRTADCVGLIKGYGWLDVSTLSIEYGANGMQDLNADQMYATATVRGSMDTMPETPGIALWKQGHIGVYIGNGYAIEAVGTKQGVVKTKVDGRGWEGWCQVPGVTYGG